MELPPTTSTVETPKKSGFFRELLSYAILALVVVLPIRMWVAQPFVVNGSSMDTTFADGEYLIVDELSYRFKAPERGDVLIFKYPQDPSKYFIKRLIGLPGETVVVKNDKVTIVNADNPKGIVLNEPYIHSRTFGDLTKTLEDDEYFVMGDNRVVSSDSRVWGALPKSDVVGRPIMRLLPLSGFDLWPGKVASTTVEAKE
ncbi:MAG: signal peptidase I [Candidatus Taylorbacteria bacterium]|nr:signal peptidase I [Candidatus Taylorbacteria bacterium]